MVEKDTWVYQRGGGSSPWALYIVYRYEKRHPRQTMEMDVTCYHESVDSPTRRKTWYRLHQDSVADFAADVSDKISQIVEVTDNDRAQLERSFEFILHQSRK